MMLNEIFLSSESISHYQPLVSVVIPTYNSSATIKEAINSVLFQSYKNIEIIVVDDCSIDDTCAVVLNLAGHFSQIKLIRLENNSGTPSRPRNVGILSSNGLYVALLDSDDIWHPEKILIQINVIAHTKISACSTSMQNFTDASDIDWHLFSNNIKLTKIKLSDQLFKYRTPTSSFIALKKLFLDNPFPEDLKYPGREDLLCSLNIHQCIEYSLKIELPLLFYRIHSGQSSFNKFDMIKGQLMTLKKFRLSNENKLGFKIYFYFLSYILYSIYFRILLKKL